MAATKKRAFLLFAIDTNPLLDWSAGYDDIPQCFDLIKKRVPGISIIVPPTVLTELGYFAQKGRKKMQESATKALELIRDETLLRPMNLVPVGQGIVDINAWEIWQAGLIDVDEVHDSMILAEAGLLECEVLLTSDKHLTGIDHSRLSEVMRTFDGSVPIIRSLYQILKQFSPK